MARELNIFDVPLLSDDEARDILFSARWPFNDPRCPICGGSDLYFLRRRNVMRCKKCKDGDFSITSGTSFANAKGGPKHLLLQAMLFARAPKGKASLSLCRDLGVQQKTAFVAMHKFRHLIRQEQSKLVLDGIVEIDGAVFGGHRVNSNSIVYASGMRRVHNHGRNRRVVVVMHQRGGRTVTAIVRKESDSIGRIIQHVSPSAIIQTDQARAWDSLKELFTLMRVNHKYAFSANLACTNNAESFFSQLRKMHVGTHHQFSAQYMGLYAAEMAWRLDHRRMTDWERAQEILKMALAPCKDNYFKGYWQKHLLPETDRDVEKLLKMATRIDKNLAEAA